MTTIVEETAFLKVKNRVYSKLAAAITAGATSLTVTLADAGLFPDTYPYHLTIEDEIVSVTNRVSNTLTIVRAQQDTTAATHANKTYVALNITAKAVSDLNAAVNTIEQALEQGINNIVINGTADYPLDLNGATVNSGGADIRLSNAALIDNSVDGTLKLQTTASGYVSISEGQIIAKCDYLDLDLDVALRFIGTGKNIDGHLVFRDDLDLGRSGAPITIQVYGGTIDVRGTLYVETTFRIGDSYPFSDSAGVLTLQNIDAIDATTENTIEAAIDTLANLVSVQGHTVTLTGDLIRSGAHSLTLITTATTSLTLPTSGTLISGDLFDADTFLYASSDNTPVATSPANVLAALTGHAGATFDWNDQSLTGVGNIVIDAAATYAIELSGTINSGVGIYGHHTQTSACYAGIWYAVTSTVTSGDVTAIRGIATGNAASAGANVRGGYFEAKAGASKYAAMLEGILSHADYSAGGVTVSGDVRGFTAHISQGSGLNAANLYGILISIQTRGDETITTDDVGLKIKNEAVGGNGRTMDAAILIDDVNMGGGVSGFTYGIDLNGAGIATADIRFSGGQVITSAAVLTMPAFTAGGDIIGQATYDLGSVASPFAEAYIGNASDYLKVAIEGNVPSLRGMGAYLRVGGTATSHTLNAEADFMVAGRLEVDGTTYFDGGALFYSNFFVYGASNLSAYVYLYADLADGNDDLWRLESKIDAGGFALGYFGTGSWVDMLTLSAAGTLTALGLGATTLQGTLALNGQTFDAGAGIALITTSNTTGLTLQGSAATHNAGLKFDHTHTTPEVTNNLGQLSYYGFDGAGTPVSRRWGYFYLNYTNVGDGTEEATYGWAAMTGGTPDNLAMTLSGAGALWTDLNVSTTTLVLLEQASAPADVANYGQFWVKNDTPNVPMFTDDAGTDHFIQLGASGTKHITCYPLEASTGNVGNWAVETIASNQSVHFVFHIPSDFEALVSVKVLMIPDATETIQWDNLVSVSAAGEAQDNDERSALDQTLAVTAEQITEVDITGSEFTGLVVGDSVAVDFQSDITNLRILKLLVEYS